MWTYTTYILYTRIQCIRVYVIHIIYSTFGRPMKPANLNCILADLLYGPTFLTPNASCGCGNDRLGLGQAGAVFSNT